MPVKTRSPHDNDPELESDLQELVRLIRPVIGALKRGSPPPAIFHEAFHRGALGPRHAPVLMVVALEGQLSVSDIAERIDLSLSTTSLLVGELDRAGVLARREDDRDRRRTLVGLSDVYREAADEWLQTRLTPLRRTLERLSPTARAGFLEGWRALQDEMTQAAAPPDPLAGNILPLN
jgi:DNA-binding MarR family transcriptional regulator